MLQFRRIYVDWCWSSKAVPYSDNIEIAKRINERDQKRNGRKKMNEIESNWSRQKLTTIKSVRWELRWEKRIKGDCRSSLTYEQLHVRISAINFNDEISKRWKILSISVIFRRDEVEWLRLQKQLQALKFRTIILYFLKIYLKEGSESNYR